MTSSRLDNLVAIGQLEIEPGTRAEFEGLLASGAARIKDAQNESLSVDSRFDLAYNAAHAFALAALRYSGYRAKTRYHVFQSLQDTLAVPAAQWRVLDQAHRKRNTAEYEGNVEVDLKLVEGVITVALELQTRLGALIPLAT